jgi:hypothetical protein
LGGKVENWDRSWREGRKGRLTGEVENLQRQGQGQRVRGEGGG